MLSSVGVSLVVLMACCWGSLDSSTDVSNRWWNFEGLLQVVSQKKSPLRCNVHCLGTDGNVHYVPALCLLPIKVTLCSGSSFWQQNSSLVSWALHSHQATAKCYSLFTVNVVSAFTSVWSMKVPTVFPLRHSRGKYAGSQSALFPISVEWCLYVNQWFVFPGRKTKYKVIKVTQVSCLSVPLRLKESLSCSNHPSWAGLCCEETEPKWTFLWALWSFSRGCLGAAECWWLPGASCANILPLR